MTVTAPMPSAEREHRDGGEAGRAAPASARRSRRRAGHPPASANERASRCSSLACSTPPNVAPRRQARLFRRQAAPAKVVFEQREVRVDLARQLRAPRVRRTTC